MHRVVRHVQKERLVRANRIGDMRIGLDRQCLGQKRFGAVVFLQVRDGARISVRAQAIILLAVVTARCSDRGTPDVDVEAQVLWLGTFDARAPKCPLRRGSFGSRLLATAAASSRRSPSNPPNPIVADRTGRGCCYRD